MCQNVPKCFRNRSQSSQTCQSVTFSSFDVSKPDKLINFMIFMIFMKFIQNVEISLSFGCLFYCFDTSKTGYFGVLQRWLERVFSQTARFPCLSRVFRQTLLTRVCQCWQNDRKDSQKGATFSKSVSFVKKVSVFVRNVSIKSEMSQLSQKYHCFVRNSLFCQNCQNTALVTLTVC